MTFVDIGALRGQLDAPGEVAVGRRLTETLGHLLDPPQVIHLRENLS